MIVVADAAAPVSRVDLRTCADGFGRSDFIRTEGNEQVWVVLSQQLPSKSPELLDVDVILQDDSPAVDEQLEEADIDGENADGGVWSEDEADLSRCDCFQLCWRAIQREAPPMGGKERRRRSWTWRRAQARPETGPSGAPRPLSWIRPGKPAWTVPSVRGPSPWPRSRSTLRTATGRRRPPTGGPEPTATEVGGAAFYGLFTRCFSFRRLFLVFKSATEATKEEDTEDGRGGGRRVQQHRQVHNTAARLELQPQVTLFALRFHGNREKCYICRALVPLRDYSRHTELCIQQQDAKVLRADRPIPASRSHKITAALTFQRENLLSALDKTESRDSGESQRRFPPNPGDSS